MRVYYQRSQAIKTDVIKRQSLEFAHAKCGMAGIGDWGGNSPAEYWSNPIREHKNDEPEEDEVSTEEEFMGLVGMLNGGFFS